MKEKTLRQIEAMKTQTIGVEIEMAEITRRKAIGVVADYFGTRDTIEHVGAGYDSWACKDRKGRKWTVMRDVSIHASSDLKKAELVTPILKYDDIEDLQEIVRKLRKAGAISNPIHGCGVHIHIGANGHDPKTLRNLANIMAAHEDLLIGALNLDHSIHGCGVHIHIGANGHDPKTLRNLANIMAAHEDLLIGALNLDHSRVIRYARTVDPDFLERLNKQKPKTMSKLADIWYDGVIGGRNMHYNNSRYRMLNYHSTFTKGTIEFRLMSKLADIWYDGVIGGRNMHYNNSRYRMLNYHSTFTKGTIEFRLFQFDNPTEDRKGGLHAGQLKSYIQLCLALSQMAKDVKSARSKPHQRENKKFAMRTWLLRLGHAGQLKSYIQLCLALSQMAKDVKSARSKPHQRENKKFAMRTWLLRLGFIGDEFKTARDVFTNRLDGDTAFRFGRP